jgi:hypothetical protein
MFIVIIGYICIPISLFLFICVRFLNKDNKELIQKLTYCQNTEDRANKINLAYNELSYKYRELKENFDEKVKHLQESYDNRVFRLHDKYKYDAESLKFQNDKLYTENELLRKTVSELEAKINNKPLPVSEIPFEDTLL